MKVIVSIMFFICCTPVQAVEYSKYEQLLEKLETDALEFEATACAETADMFCHGLVAAILQNGIVLREELKTSEGYVSQISSIPELRKRSIETHRKILRHIDNSRRLLYALAGK
ncbi:hypothetical protein KTR10_01030 [Candidatus Kaiserbacteria bacterium]|nr:hypothetical protein [Candidatus Kaiserbacteria bacterium]